jgi:alkylation response protein AidB-like acyl-CoA dehydrogenase
MMVVSTRRWNTVFGGTTEIQKEIIGRSLGL